MNQVNFYIMKKTSVFFLLLMMVLPLFLNGQNKSAGKSPLKVEVFYFHPNERCPIDLSIEENTRATMQSSFSGRIKEGTIIFKVLNTDDKANAKIAAKFEINAQALYIVKHDKGKEIKNDLTDFAFSCGQSDPEKFKRRLKDEIETALK
jgi:hypothetical protein